MSPETLSKRMKRFQIEEDDLEEQFVLGSGSGGQKINKTSSCVYLKHLPSGYEVSCQDSRSREKNRTMARARLCEIFEKKEAEELREKARLRARKRFLNKKPSKREKARRRKAKEKRSEKKQWRRDP